MVWLASQEKHLPFELIVRRNVMVAQAHQYKNLNY
jgi:hypothetical protein